MIPTLRENPKSTKDCILLMLSAGEPLTIKKLYNAVTKKYNLSVTYHAVYKTANHMVSEKILNKNGKKYFINPDWIRQTKFFITSMENAANGNSKPPVEKLFTGEITTVNFSSLFEFYDYMVDFLTDFALRGNKKIYGIFYHLYWALSFEGERYVKFRKMINNFKIGYLISLSNTKVDRIIGDYYKSFNPVVSITYSKKYTKTYDMFVCGSYLAQVFFEYDFRRKLDKVYALNISDKKTMKNLMETLFFTKTRITLVVTKNKELAEEIKEQIYIPFKNKRDRNKFC